MEVISDQEKVIQKLRRRSLIERIIIASLALFLVVVFIHARLAGGKSFIVVNGKAVACVPSERIADDILRQIKSRTGCNPDEIKFAQDVRVARAPRDTDTVSRHMAVRLLERVVSPVVPRWAIIVDGRPLAAVSNKQTAGETLDLAKYRYGKLASNLAEEPQFKQNVKVDLILVEPSIYRNSAQEAVDELFSTSSSTQSGATYTVRKGDLAGAIAARNHVKLDDLIAMNSGRNLDRLQIGDQIHIKGGSMSTKPRLTVVVRDQTDRTEAIPAPIEKVASTQLHSGITREIAPGKPGEKRVKAATIYENGRKTGSEVLEETILRQPVPRRVAVGIKHSH